MLRLDLGAGDIHRSGFLSVDLYDAAADLRADICELPFEPGSVDEIMCIQVIEHVPYQRSEQMFAEMWRVLKPGGFATIETPDIDVVCRKILEEGLLDKWIYNLVGQYYRPHDQNRYDDWENNAASIHRNPWNERRLRGITDALGFAFERLPMEAMEYKYEENLACRLQKPAL